jgi:hypothetical protein
MYVERPRGCYSDRPEHSPAKLPCYRAHGHLDAALLTRAREA